ncbi:MAG TPA: UvrD-helicase domain-containing protein [Nitrospiraceae bacterium]|nr:UvrD-helicase domain-containing protein [Nitrospiraceae bacterium]
MEQIPDRQARDLAETTFDRNVVVVAGAGTGKTTLLVNRLVHLLIKEPVPIAMTQIVALTFTNKASTEMKVRLRERLTALTQSTDRATLRTDGGAVSVEELRQRYGLTTDEVARRAGAALQDLEKAQIGTLHSFAAHLLRLYPLESGVDPAFQEDDGLRFEEHFTTAWDIWIDQELSRQGTHHDLWRSLLGTTAVEDLRALTRSLCSELVELDAIRDQVEATDVSPTLLQWWRRIGNRAEVLLASHDRPKRRKIEQMLAATVSFMNLLVETGSRAIHDLPASDRDLLAKDPGNMVGGWEHADFDEASSLIKSAQQLLLVDHSFFKNLLSLISPFALDIRTSFTRKGWLSFDGLLARARLLLRNHPAVRERIKQEYHAVLVDEFQDTDPVQYEIILAVSERLGSYSTNWEELALEAGKLFIVGDPKQSIYAFRRADIEAFDRVVQKIASCQGMVQTLTTNFRSDAAVLGPVNDVFDRLFEHRPLVQPANVRLHVRPQQRPAAVEPGVHLYITSPSGEGETFDAAGATRAEGEVLARWLTDDLLNRPTMKPGHVALLFRKLTQADAYLDALRRYGIPYVIEGEKHFYRRQEVIDLVNVLRVLDHPHDSVALAGLLRSPVGGLTDRDLYDLRSACLFDYLREKPLDSWKHAQADAVRRLYGQLAQLHHEIGALPLAEAIQLVFDRLPILELAGASLHGEQAVANLLKVKQTAATLSDRPHLTLSAFVDLLVSRLEDRPDEAESPLAEESVEAVQVLTIHKAKGLEFPVVILPGLHQGTGRERALPNVVYDWSSGTYGLSLGNRFTFGSVLIREKLTLREQAERRRVLYVGMTRAKELLVLSGGSTARSVGENVLELLQDIGEGEIGAESTQTLTIGGSLIPHQVVKAPDRKRPLRTLSTATGTCGVDPASIALLWNGRTAHWTTARETPLQLTPTGLVAGPAPGPRPSTMTDDDRESSRLAGVLAHRLLERCDFSTASDRLLNEIAPTVRRGLSPEEERLSPSIIASLNELFTVFVQSEAYARLRTATILGREVPFVMPWGEQQLVEGVIDVIYRLDGRIWIADYKTDQVAGSEVQKRVSQYMQQAEMYRTAASRCLDGTAVSFHFLFLRSGKSVEI